MASEAEELEEMHQIATGSTWQKQRQRMIDRARLEYERRKKED